MAHYGITESSGGNPKRCFSHDADGNLVTIGEEGSSGCSDSVPIRTLVWDKVNRLTSVSETGVLGSYVYDPFGRRIAKTVASTTTKFLWDGDQLLAEYQGTTRTRRYEYAGGFSPARVQMGTSALLEVHTDHLDTPRMLTDATKATFWQASYEAYGEAQLEVDPGASLAFNVRFPGQYFDPETGLHYNWHRYYDPSLGRYVSADPIGQFGGPNLYAYAANQPTNRVDILGLVDDLNRLGPNLDYETNATPEQKCLSDCIGTALANLANPLPIDIPFRGTSGDSDGGVSGAEALEGAAKAGELVSQPSQSQTQRAERASELLNRNSAAGRNPRKTKKLERAVSELESAKRLSKKLGVVGKIIGVLDFGSEVSNCKELCRNPNSCEVDL